MLFSASTILSLGLALSQTALAIPAPAPVEAASKREVFNGPVSTMFIDCGTGYKWAKPEIEAAVQLGTNTADYGIGNFPHTFGNNKKLKFNGACDGRKLKEFPLVAGNKLFNGNNLELSRVVYSPYNNGAGDATFCGVMTHAGMPQGEFRLCNAVW
ncbi:Ribonuclease/ribotoxin [Phaeosphaeriaceae sp. PMI808]|nr:Ribonuclease/ribotoxin [Phaeosphaeriaceae sp. PMI808]